MAGSVPKVRFQLRPEFGIRGWLIVCVCSFGLRVACELVEYATVRWLMACFSGGGVGSFNIAVAFNYAFWLASSAELRVCPWYCRSSATTSLPPPYRPENWPRLGVLSVEQLNRIRGRECSA